MLVTYNRVVPSAHDEANSEGLPVDVGRVQKGDQVFLDELVGDPGVEVVEATPDHVAVVLDLEADGLHCRLVQVLFEGRKKLQGIKIELLRDQMSMGACYSELTEFEHFDFSKPIQPR